MLVMVGELAILFEVLPEVRWYSLTNDLVSWKDNTKS